MKTFFNVFKKLVYVLVGLVLNLAIDFGRFEVILEDKILSFDESFIHGKSFEIFFHVFDFYLTT